MDIPNAAEDTVLHDPGADPAEHPWVEETLWMGACLEFEEADTSSGVRKESKVHVVAAADFGTEKAVAEKEGLPGEKEEDLKQNFLREAGDPNFPHPSPHAVPVYCCKRQGRGISERNIPKEISLFPWAIPSNSCPNSRNLARSRLQIVQGSRTSYLLGCRSSLRPLGLEPLKGIPPDGEILVRGSCPSVCVMFLLCLFCS